MGRARKAGVAVKSLGVRGLVKFWLFGVLIFAQTNCGLGDAVDKILHGATNATTAAVMSIDEAVTALQNQSANWQQVLQDLEGKLVKEGQATIRDEVATVLSRSISQAGVELRCDADFVRDRVRQALIGIKAKLLGDPIPPLPPAFCQVVPIAVDREAVPDHVKQLEIYGYDFDSTQNLSVLLASANGGRQNVTSKLDRPTHYAMTLKFGASGVQLDPQSDHFEILLDNKLISTVAVIQPATPVCESKPVPVSPGNVTFMPRKVGGGDADFGGNGPHIFASVHLIASPQSLVAHAFMDARETRSDFTSAMGTQDFPLYTPPPGWAIDHVQGPVDSFVSYTDTTPDVNDRFSRGAGEPVKDFLFVGDTSGPEAGSRTKMDVSFNQITVVIVQNVNCVSDEAIQRLRRISLISNVSLLRLQPQADKEALRRANLLRMMSTH